MTRKLADTQAISATDFARGQAVSCMATCPRGVEFALSSELAELGAAAVQESVAAVYFEADRPTLYKICLWTRIASRVVLLLQRGRCDSTSDFSNRLSALPWSDWFDASAQSIAVDFNGSNAFIRDSRYGAQLTKDAIVDHCKEQGLSRPSVNPDNPEVLVYLRLFKQRYSVGFDLIGERLHKRGYRQQSAIAPLRENLAAALLRIAGWPAIAAAGGGFVDPMCGSGTILIEAALMAGKVAPAALPPMRNRNWLLANLTGFDARQWQTEFQRACDSADKPEGLPSVLKGCDISPGALQAARANVAAAGLEQVVQLKQVALADLQLSSLPEQGLVLCNPPYGKRLGEQKDLQQTYRELGDWLKRDCVGWQAALFTGNPDLGWSTGLRSYRQHHLANGGLPCDLQRYRVEPERFIEPRLQQQKEPADPWSKSRARPLSEAATMLLNRMRKNRQRLKSWLGQTGVSCYRLYDAELPEYAFAVDVYLGSPVSRENKPLAEPAIYCHLQEYAPPASVDARKAEQRIDDGVQVLCELLELRPDAVVVKRRQRQRGSQQYQKQAESGQDLRVEEGGYSFIVNLQRYLDTGLFLDSRGVRRQIAAAARGGRFLNLFAYTGTASVYAAKGGARSSVSVDLSQTYNRWARRNLALNGLSSSQHQVIHADCRDWLENHQKDYDCVLLDPPSFSNSRRMDGTLDIQRDHQALIGLCMERLAPDGSLFFVTNRRGFKLEPTIAQEFDVQELTQKTLDRDFAQRGNAHRCWQIKQLP